MPSHRKVLPLEPPNQPCIIADAERLRAKVTPATEPARLVGWRPGSWLRLRVVLVVVAVALG